MDKKPKPSVFCNPAFISALVILLLNDHFLKYTYPGFITGKLSDITGLFVFHLFLLQLFPAKAKQVTIFIVLFFIWWKSPLSQIVIDFFNSFQLFTIQRVIDYLDLLSLPVLFLSWRVFYQRKTYRVNFYPVLRILIFMVSIYSFLATSMMMKPIIVSSKRNVKHTSSEIVKQLSTSGHTIKVDTFITAAKYEYYSIRMKDSLLLTDSLSVHSFILYPQSKKRTRIEVSLAYWNWSYDAADTLAFDKRKTRKELKNWLKQFE